MAVTVVSTTTGATASGGTSITLSVPSLAVGDHIVVCVASGGAAVSTVTDTLSTTYTRAARSSTWSYLSAWYGRVTAAGTATITVTLAASTHGAAVAYRISGLSAGVLDQAVTSASSSSGTATPGATVTTTQASEIVIGAAGVYLGAGTIGYTAASGYTGTRVYSTPTTSTTITLGAEYQVVSTAGSQTASATLGWSTLWDALTISLKGATIAAVTPAVTTDQAVQLGARKTRALGAAGSVDQAVQLGRVKRLAITPATTTDQALPLLGAAPTPGTQTADGSVPVLTPSATSTALTATGTAAALTPGGTP